MKQQDQFNQQMRELKMKSVEESTAWKNKMNELHMKAQ